MWSQVWADTYKWVGGRVPWVTKTLELSVNARGSTVKSCVCVCVCVFVCVYCVCVVCVCVCVCVCVTYLGEALEHDLGVFCHDLSFKKSYIAVHSDRQSSALSQSLSLSLSHPHPYLQSHTCGS